MGEICGVMLFDQDSFVGLERKTFDRMKIVESFVGKRSISPAERNLIKHKADLELKE